MPAGLARGVDAAEPYDADALNALQTIVLDASALPEPITRDHAEYVKVELESVERVARLDDGTAFTYWTFNGKVPGPFVRVRVGDTVEVTMKNAADSMMLHSVDFHAVTSSVLRRVGTLFFSTFSSRCSPFLLYIKLILFF